VSVPDDASVRSVQRALVGHRVHAVLVVSAHSAEPVGWATATGVLEHMLGTDTALMPAALAVTEPAESISPSATAEEALRLMLATGCARLLVRRHPGAPAEGVVSEMDVVRLGTSG
jgi:CBS domain-containing protein